MSAGTITLTNGSAIVGGSGTSFATELAAGDFIVSTVGGVPYTLPVKSVESNAQLTLVSNFTGPTQTGAAWSAVPRVALNMITAALVAQSAEALRGLNYDKQNWQLLFSATGDITVRLPDGSTFTGPAWKEITSTLSGKIDKNQNLRDLDNIYEALKNLGWIDGFLPLSLGGLGAGTQEGGRSALGLGTAATANIGTGANQVPDMNSFALAPGGGGASFRRLPGGDIIQMGRLQTSASNTLTGTLNVPFPNGNYNIIAVAQDQQASITCAPLTGNTFAISAWNIGSTGGLGSRVTTLVSWLAWGN